MASRNNRFPEDIVVFLKRFKCWKIDLFASWHAVSLVLKVQRITSDDRVMTE